MRAQIWPKNVFSASLVDVQYLFKSVPASLFCASSFEHFAPQYCDFKRQKTLWKI